MSNAYGDLVVLNNSINSEAERSIMAQKRWAYVLDQSTGNYNNAQSIIETSSIGNSQWIDFRQAYLAVPVIITAQNVTASDGNASNAVGMIAPATAATSCDWMVGLKNWYGSLIHSMSVDVNGRNIIQQTQLISLYNNFQLVSSFSLNDVLTQGSTIGFYPDDPLSYKYYDAKSTSGIGVTNNDISQSPWQNVDLDTQTKAFNEGLFNRISYINYDPQGSVGDVVNTYLQSDQSTQNLYRNYIFRKYDASTNTGKHSIVQWQIMAIIKLRHMHNFFQNVVLGKNLQFKFTLNLNQVVTKVSIDGSDKLTQTLEYSSYSGVNPLMFISCAEGQTPNGTTLIKNPSPICNSIIGSGDIRISLYVGNKCLSSAQNALEPNPSPSNLPTSIALYAPCYDMLPQTEALYLQNPNKSIIYTDIYYYPITNIAGGANFKQLISNGLAGVKSVLIIPAFNSSATTAGKYTQAGLPQYQSIFDSFGGGTTTAPLASLTNFQVILGGQNQLLNSNGRYNWEIFNNFLYGANSINAGLSEGITSGLLTEQAFNHQPYYYIDCSRGIPIESTIPKSLSIEGTNESKFACDYHVFVEYQNKISINILSGLLL